MPTIICSYCQYVGSGNSIAARYENVELHELNCPENPEYQKKHIVDNCKNCEVAEYNVHEKDCPCFEVCYCNRQNEAPDDDGDQT